MQRKTFLRGCAAAGVSALAFAHVARAQNSVKMRFAHASPENSSQHHAALRLAQNAKAASGGVLDIRVYPNSQLGNDATVIGGVRGGNIDIMFSGANNFAGLVPQWDGLELPFLFSGPAHVARVFDGHIGQELFRPLATHGLHGLTWLENGFRCISNKNHAVERPEHVRGLKIRVSPSPMHVLIWRLLGANPVPMPIAELYQALESGAVDAQEHPISVTHAAKYYEVQKHLTMSRHVYTALPVVINQKKFNALPAPLQSALQQAAREAAQWQRADNLHNEARMIAEFRQHGMQVLENYDAQPFRELVAAGTRKEYVAKFGNDLLAAIAGADA